METRVLAAGAGVAAVVVVLGVIGVQELGQFTADDTAQVERVLPEHFSGDTVEVRLNVAALGDRQDAFTVVETVSYDGRQEERRIRVEPDAGDRVYYDVTVPSDVYTVEFSGDVVDRDVAVGGDEQVGRTDEAFRYVQLSDARYDGQLPALLPDSIGNAALVDRFHHRDVGGVLGDHGVTERVRGYYENGETFDVLIRRFETADQAESYLNQEPLRQHKRDLEVTTVTIGGEDVYRYPDGDGGSVLRWGHGNLMYTLDADNPAAVEALNEVLRDAMDA